ncbi:hypothetical protein QUB80_06405 [Chlorogloeopsis sp. ULAP01]|nr:hypothetical protein [Chlorogloeopsis sp. ULAP01]
MSTPVACGGGQSVANRSAVRGFPPLGRLRRASPRCRNCPLETLPRALAHQGAAHRTLTGSHSAYTNFSQIPKSTHWYEGRSHKITQIH